MSWGAYAILVIFGLFVLLLIINPRMSCFGKRIKSPLYPLTRKRRARKKMTDYHFDLNQPGAKKTARPEGPGPGKETDKAKQKKTDDYGFHLN